jgi:hypothetical protein
MSPGDGRDLGRHDPARRLLLVAEKLADLSRLLHAHEPKEGLGLVVRQVADDVSGVVGVHDLEDVRGPLAVEVLDDVRLQLVLEFRDRLGRLVVVKVFEDLGPLRRRQLLEDVRHVGGVQLVETLVRHRQRHAAEVALEEVDVIPRDEVFRDLGPEQLRDGVRGALERRSDPTQEAAQSHFGPKQAHLTLRLREFEVVHADDLHALGVDDLLVEQIAVEQDLIGLEVGEAQIGARRVEDHPLPVELGDELAPREHERRLVRAEEGE